MCLRAGLIVFTSANAIREIVPAHERRRHPIKHLKATGLRNNKKTIAYCNQLVHLVMGYTS